MCPSPPTNLRVVTIDGVAPKIVPSKDPAGIFDGNGNFDANAYVNAADAYGTPAMIAERFGSSWTAYHQKITAPTWTQASQYQVRQPGQSNEWLLLLPRRSVHHVDDYSSNYAQVAYVTDSAVAGQPTRS